MISFGGAHLRSFGLRSFFSHQAYELIHFREFTTLPSGHHFSGVRVAWASCMDWTELIQQVIPSSFQRHFWASSAYSPVNWERRSWSFLLSRYLFVPIMTHPRIAIAPMARRSRINIIFIEILYFFLRCCPLLSDFWTYFTRKIFFFISTESTFIDGIIFASFLER